MLLKNSLIKILLPKVIEPAQTLAPLSTTTMFGCLGDALAIACSKRKKWSNKKFISNHPSGTLATALIQVHEIMATGKEMPIVNANVNMKVAIKEMSRKHLGVVCVKEKNGKINLITDGDVRRNSNNLFKKNILKICKKNPVWISDASTALSAIEKMNSLKITSLLVTKKKDINKKIKKISGILHLHHCLSRGIK